LRHTPDIPANRKQRLIDDGRFRALPLQLLFHNIPYPVEILLPEWTVQHDWDLRNWLFRWGDGIRIESPLELQHLHLNSAQAVVDLYSRGA